MQPAALPRLLPSVPRLKFLYGRGPGFRGGLGPAKGRQRSFQPSMKRRMAANEVRDAAESAASDGLAGDDAEEDFARG